MTIVIFLIHFVTAVLRLATHLKFVNDPTNIINAIDNDSLVMDVLVYVNEWLQRLKAELTFCSLRT